MPEHIGVEPYVNALTYRRDEPSYFILLFLKFAEFTLKDKARNASSVSGFLPQDAAKVVNSLILTKNRAKNPANIVCTY